MEPEVKLFSNRRTFVRPMGDLTKRADVDLGGNPQTWFSATLGVFGTQHPEVSGAPFATSLSFKKQDLVEGAATGTVTVSGGPHLLSFPAIIRDGKLAPFDLVFIDDKLRYADPGLVAAYASPYRPAMGIASKDVPGAPDTTDALHIDKVLPGMRTVLASYSLDEARNDLRFEDLIGTMTDDQRNRMLKWAMAYPDYWGTATDTFKAAMRTLHNPPAPKAAPKVDPLAESWHDAAIVRRSGINRYRVLLGKHAHLDCASVDTDSAGVRKLAKAYKTDADSLLARVDQFDDIAGMPVCVRRNQGMLEKTAADSLAYELSSSIASTASPGEVSSYGTYEVYFKDRGPQRALVLPVVDWDFKRTQTKLVIADNTFAVTERVYGRPSVGRFILPKGNISRGVWGAFVYESTERSFSTMPFEVIAIRDTPAGLAIAGVDVISNTKLNLVKVHGIKTITKMDPKVDPGLYMHGHVNAYIPAVMEFVPLPAMNDAVAPDPSSVFKSAAANYEMLLSDGRAWLPKGALAKSAGVQHDTLPEKRVLDDEQTLMALAVTGHYNTKLAHGVISGDIPTHLTLSMPLAPEAPEVKTASAPMWSDIELARAAHAVNQVTDYDAFMKVATTQGNRKALDTILSINVMSDRNMKYFMDNIGILRDCETYLARLLLMSRLANIGVDEADLKAALESLVSIKNTLARLGMLREE